MTDKEKLEKLMKLADAMYYAAQNLTTDASRLHKAMDEYHKFIIYEYHKEEPTIPEIVDEHFDEMLGEEPANEDLGEYISELSKQFPEVSFAKLSRIAVRVAKWQKQQMMTKAVEVEISDNGCTKGLQFIPVWPFTDEYVGGDKVKLIIIKED